MSFHSWLQSLRSTLAPGRGQRNPRRRGSLRAATHRPHLEALEVRSLLSTFTVTNLLDSGPDSLLAAVAAANAHPGPDAIDFATTGTVTLTSGQLSITDSLSIRGPGVNALTISGGRRQPGLFARRHSHRLDREPDGRQRPGLLAYGLQWWRHLHGRWHSYSRPLPRGREPCDQ